MSSTLSSLLSSIPATPVSLNDILGKLIPCSKISSSGVHPEQRTLYFVPHSPSLCPAISPMTYFSSSNSRSVLTYESGITESVFLQIPLSGVAVSGKRVGVLSF